jgi:hypothetical protein
MLVCSFISGRFRRSVGPPVGVEHCFPIASIHPDGRSDDPTAKKKKSGDVADSFLKEWNRLSLYRMLLLSETNSFGPYVARFRKQYCKAQNYCSG